MTQLPALPPSVRPLTSAESDRLVGKQAIHGPIDLWCPTCFGAKTFRWWNDMSIPLTQRDPVQYDCPCYEQFLLWRWFGYHGVERYGRTFWGDAFAVPKPIMDKVEDYLSDMDWYSQRGHGLYLHGLTGNGKTLLASLVLRRYMEKGYTGFFATWDTMLDQYTSGWRDEEERAWFDQTVRAAQVLVIDDLGKENANRGEVGRAALDSVIRGRVQGGRVTILTTNLNDADFTKLYSSSIVSLAHEVCESIQFVGSDFRSPGDGVRFPDLLNMERTGHLTRPMTFGS